MSMSFISCGDEGSGNNNIIIDNNDPENPDNGENPVNPPEPNEPQLPDIPINPVSDFTVNISGSQITGYIGESKSVNIPSVINGKTILYIGDNVFKNKGLTDVIIPNTVESIGISAFEGNDLTNIIIPESVKTIKNYAFRNNKITYFTIHLNIENIGSEVFAFNKIKKLTMPVFSNLLNPSSDCGGMFKNNEIDDLDISGVKYISNNMFENNKLKGNIVFPESIIVVGSEAFYGNEINSFIIKSKDSLIYNCFTNGTIKNVTFPEGYDKFGVSVRNQLIEEVIIPNNCLVRQDSFNGNPIKKVIVIGNNVDIRLGAFPDWNNIVVNPNALTDPSKIVYVYDNITSIVPAGTYIRQSFQFKDWGLKTNCYVKY